MDYSIQKICWIVFFFFNCTQFLLEKWWNYFFFFPMRKKMGCQIQRFLCFYRWFLLTVEEHLDQTCWPRLPIEEADRQQFGLWCLCSSRVEINICDIQNLQNYNASLCMSGKTLSAHLEHRTHCRSSTHTCTMEQKESDVCHLYCFPLLYESQCSQSRPLLTSLTLWGSWKSMECGWYYLEIFKETKYTISKKDIIVTSLCVWLCEDCGKCVHGIFSKNLMHNMWKSESDCRLKKLIIYILVSFSILNPLKLFQRTIPVCIWGLSQIS